MAFRIMDDSDLKRVENFALIKGKSKKENPAYNNRQDFPFERVAQIRCPFIF